MTAKMGCFQFILFHNNRSFGDIMLCGRNGNGCFSHIARGRVFVINDRHCSSPLSCRRTTTTTHEDGSGGRCILLLVHPHRRRSIYSVWEMLRNGSMDEFDGCSSSTGQFNDTDRIISMFTFLLLLWPLEAVYWKGNDTGGNIRNSQSQSQHNWL